MAANISSPNNCVVRIERDRLDPMNHPKVGKTPRMEETMFEALMKFGGYRVDYMHNDQIGTSSALGLYVLGDLPVDQSYSRAAKRSLFTALCLLREQHEIDNLAAIYLDINSPVEAHRPAYQQMKRDMKAGLFHRLCVPSVCDLIGDEQVYADFWNFYRGLEWCEIISTEPGRLTPVLFSEMADCPMVSGY